MIFVFGSNLAGRHGAGAARVAWLKHGAMYGIGNGLMGNSYAIPTKDRKLDVLPIDEIAWYVTQFIAHAELDSDENFQVTQIGCGLAGYKPEQIAPLFADAPSNCHFDTAWKPWLPCKNFWGTR